VIRLPPLGIHPASTAATASPAGAAPPGGLQILIPDACVGVKWCVPEPDSQAAARLLDPRFALHVPDYFFIEAASVLQRKVALEGTLSESDALDVYRLLRTVPMTIHATEALLENSIRHGVRYRRPVYDSLYLMLAASRGGRVVTADGRLYRGVHGGLLDHLVLWVTDPL
jgi:predicted nucleic acid-binding protein